MFDIDRNDPELVELIYKSKASVFYVKNSGLKTSDNNDILDVAARVYLDNYDDNEARNNDLGLSYDSASKLYKTLLANRVIQNISHLIRFGKMITDKQQLNLSNDVENAIKELRIRVHNSEVEQLLNKL